MKQDYPIFNGKVHAVHAIVEMDSEIYSILTYFTKDESDKLEEDMHPSKLMLLLIDDSKRAELEEKCRKGLSQVIIPLRLDPSIINGAIVRTKMGKEEINGTDKKTYELEVVEGSHRGGLDVFSMALSDSPYKGFRYIKILD